MRQRCTDGREPLDFAVDESVRQLLLAEVEKLRMGLLDELLADEAGEKSKKGKKGKHRKEVKPAAPAAGAAEGGGAAADDGAYGDGAGLSKAQKKKLVGSVAMDESLL